MIKINAPFTPAGLICTLILALSGCGSSSVDPTFASKEALGEALFSDTNLSLDRTQSCATCHNPEHGFVDNRINATYHATNVAALGCCREAQHGRLSIVDAQTHGRPAALRSCGTSLVPHLRGHGGGAFSGVNSSMGAAAGSGAAAGAPVARPKKPAGGGAGTYPYCTCSWEMKASLCCSSSQ